MSIYFIAEAGVNHNGDMNLAKQLIDCAAEAGADAVKFQTFKAKGLVSQNAPKAEYQNRTTDQAESQFEMIRKLELNHDHHVELIEHAKTRGIEFLSTPFDLESLDLLTQQFGLKTIKVPSGEVTNAPFLLEIGRRAQTILISTGMCSLADIQTALGVLAFALTAAKDAQPATEQFEQAFASEAGQQALKKHVSVLHCTTEYPTPFEEVNLKAMNAIQAAFGLPVGYSDHTPGIHISLAAAARGAQIIEKHFTMNRNLPGPDHKASLEPEELKQLVSQMRQIEVALGDGIKRPMQVEWKNRDVARKSLVASTAIKKGELFSPTNLTCKRPGNGISPLRFWERLNTPADRDYLPDELI